MGEAKRRKKQDPNYGKSRMLGGIKIQHPKYLNPKFYDERLETISPLTRTLGTTKEELLNHADFEEVPGMGIFDDEKVSRMIQTGEITGGRNFDKALKEFTPALSSKMQDLMKKSPSLALILFIIELSNGKMHVEMLEQGNKLLLEAAARACATHSTEVDAEVVRYIRGSMMSGRACIKTFTSMRLMDCIDVIENIGRGYVIYLDSHISVSRNRDDTGLPGQLFVAIKDPDGLWSFEKWQGVTVPVSSLKQAKVAITEYKQSCPINRKGKIMHRYSERLSRFLGLHIQDGFAYLNPPP